MQTLEHLLKQRRPGFSLAQDFYVSEEIFRAEIDAVFATDWVFACSAGEIRQPGDYITLEIGTTSLIVLRDNEGGIRALHNTCRHRGARICTDERGAVRRLVCPYHQWTYELDGRLRRARQMPPDFDLDAYPLKAAGCEVICGMVFVAIGENPASLASFRQAATPFLAPHQPERTKVAFTTSVVEEANWKLIIENNRECYHCPAAHPELLATFGDFALPTEVEKPADQALLDRAAAKWDAMGLAHRAAKGGDEYRCIRLPFREGAMSFTLDGAPACKRLLGELTEPDLGSVRLFRVPNNWNHILADHIIHFRVLPISAQQTQVRTTWLVHEDAVEGADYDLEHLTAVWMATNAQDRALAENNHRGVRSKAYQPGPYSQAEYMLNNFSDWYIAKMTAFLDRPSLGLAAQ